VTLGAAGLMAETHTEAFALPAPKVQAVSSHGAGDAFTGALAAELARGVELADALRFVQGAAALTVATEPDLRGGLTERRVRAFLSRLEA
jgi:ribokinase